MLHKLLLITLLALGSQVYAGETPIRKVYAFDLKDEIGPSSLRTVQKAFAEATVWKAELLLIRMNTYGGLLDKADSIRTKILHSPIPVYIFIDNNAASAGALIAIACNKIYMRQDANIGAASVVTESGELAPDKYQSYMRSMMRSTAESRGRNPQIAQAMVDGNIVVEGVNTKGQVVTLTSSEALKNGFCEGICKSDKEMLEQAGISNYELKEQKLSTIDRLIGYLINPAVSGILIMLILGGIYYELQAPGLGFPSMVAIAGALLYFAPLYLEELALNWEILMFIIGIILVALEIFVVPGFGITGVSGITLVVLSLVLSLVRNVDFDFSMTGDKEITRALATVLFSLLGFIGFLFFFGRSLHKSPYFQRLVLSNSLVDSKAPMRETASLNMMGMEGFAITDLRPLGKADINGQVYVVASLGEFIHKGTELVVVSEQWDKIVVRKKG